MKYDPVFSLEMSAKIKRAATPTIRPTASPAKSAPLLANAPATTPPTNKRSKLHPSTHPCGVGSQAAMTEPKSTAKGIPNPCLNLRHVRWGKLIPLSLDAPGFLFGRKSVLTFLITVNDTKKQGNAGTSLLNCERKLQLICLGGSETFRKEKGSDYLPRFFLW